MARETRNYSLKECRAVETSDGVMRLSGYAALYNERSATEIVSQGKAFYEVLAPGCFDDVVASGEDVKLLAGHDPNLVLASTAAGTLSLRSDSKGLHYDATLSNSQISEHVYLSVKRGDTTGMSFGFAVDQDSWAETIVNGARALLRTIRSFLKVFEISVTGFPVYTGTSAEARSLVYRPSEQRTPTRIAASFESAKPGEIYFENELFPKLREAQARRRKMTATILDL